MPLSIRPAVASDLAAIVAIEERSFDADRFANRNLRRMLGSPSAAFLLAKSGRGALGYILLLFRRGSHVARLYSIATTPEARGSGIGRALIEAAEGCAIKRGANRLRLEVRASNRAAIALYGKMGFSILKESPGYYEDGETALKMEKALASRA